MENNAPNDDEQQPFAAAEFAENPEPRPVKTISVKQVSKYLVTFYWFKLIFP